MSFSSFLVIIINPLLLIDVVFIGRLYGPLEHSEVYKINDLGIQRGLSVVMEPFLDDYLYPILPIQGWKASEKKAIKYHLRRTDRSF